MSRVIGNISRTIFKSDNDYYVLIFRVKDNDVDPSYNNKSITITGYFYDIDDNFDLSLTGEFSNHPKYGEQFSVSSYQKIIPEDKNSIVSFLSSGLFKGIGETKALKIYEKFGDDAINLIKKDPSILTQIKTLTEKNIVTLKTKLEELDQSTDTLLNLTELGFTAQDATMIYKNYKEQTIPTVNNDLYTIFYDLDKITFLKIDRIALKNGISKKDERRIKAGIIYAMKTLANERGDTYSLKEEIFAYLRIVINYEPSIDLFEKCLDDLLKSLKIIKLDEKYQLISYYEADNNIVKRLTYLNNKEDLDYKKDYLDKKILEYEKESDILYDDMQKHAIKNAFLKNILIITGGPGTGKTTIIKSIVAMYKDIFNLKLGSSFDEEVVLLAPTGRAAKRIMEATLYKASTIHRFLKWNKDTNKFQVNEHNKSKAKLVIIDEFSMVDTLLFSSLLNGLRYDTRIILVGDANQLPSVAPGELLKDLMHTELFPFIELKKLYRQKGDSNIINLAYDINNGEVHKSLFNKNTDLLFYEADSLDLKEKLVMIAKEYQDLPYHDFQIMAPMYKTLNGIDNLNTIMQNIFNPKSKNKKEIVIYDVLYREGDKVLQLMNMPDDNVYNGDIGTIVEIDNLKHEVTIDYDSNLVVFNKSNFNNFTLGYVISIHKSQGSEFKTVIIPILKEYGRMLYRKLIYTGVTRSKQKLILIGELSAYQRGVLNNRNMIRKTNLEEKIKNRYLENKI